MFTQEEEERHAAIENQRLLDEIEQDISLARAEAEEDRLRLIQFERQRQRQQAREVAANEKAARQIRKRVEVEKKRLLEDIEMKARADAESLQHRQRLDELVEQTAKAALAAEKERLQKEAYDLAAAQQAAQEEALKQQELERQRLQFETDRAEAEKAMAQQQRELRLAELAIKQREMERQRLQVGVPCLRIPHLILFSSVCF